MKRKVLALMLSAAMLGTSVAPVGAADLSGSWETADTSEFSLESAGSDFIVSEDTMEEPAGEEEGFLMENDLGAAEEPEIFGEDDGLSEEGGLFQNSADDPIWLSQGEVYDIPRRETFWYAFQPDHPGEYVIDDIYGKTPLIGTIYDNSLAAVQTITPESSQEERKFIYDSDSWNNDEVVYFELTADWERTDDDAYFAINEWTDGREAETAIPVIIGEETEFPGAGEHWFEFQPEFQGSYSLSLSCVNPVIELYDSSLEFIMTVDESEYFDIDDVNQKYYLKVCSYSDDEDFLTIEFDSSKILIWDQWKYQYEPGEYKYSFQPMKEGYYLLEVSSDDYALIEGRVSDEEENEIVSFNESDLESGEMNLFFHLTDPQKTYYLYLNIEEELDEDLSVRISSPISPVELERGKELPLEAESGYVWAKFQPDVPGKYFFESSAGAVLYQLSDAEIQKVSEEYISSGYSAVTIEDPSLPCYLRINTNDMWEDGTIICYREKTTAEIFAEHEPLPVLTERGDKGYGITEITPGEESWAYVKFIPEHTGRYTFSYGDHGSSIDYSIHHVTVYDSDFSELELDRSYELEKDKEYFLFCDNITSSGETMDLFTVYSDLASLEIESGLSRNVLYLGVDVENNYIGCGFPGVTAKISYKGGYEEYMDSMPLRDDVWYEHTKIGDSLDWLLKDIKLENNTPGTYTAQAVWTNSLTDEQSVTDIGKVEIKDITELPMLENRGTMDAVVNVWGEGWIKFKTGKEERYFISSPYVGLYDSQIDIYQWDGTKLNLVADKQNVVLEPDSIYYICVGQHFYGNPPKEEILQNFRISVKPQEPVNLSECTVTMESDVTYNGKARTPSIRIMDGNTILRAGRDYTVVYSDNVEVGTAAKATIQGKGDYTGTIEKTFQILPAVPVIKKTVSAGYNSVKITWNKVAGAESYKLFYKGGTVKKWKLVKSGLTKTEYTHKSSKLTTGTKYTYTVKAVRKGIVSNLNKTGMSAVPVPAKVKISKIVKASSGLKLTWSRIAGASGYVIQRRENGKWVTKKTITKGTAVSYIDKMIPAGKTGSYRIRAYRTVNKKKVYGAYSAVKSGKR